MTVIEHHENRKYDIFSEMCEQKNPVFFFKLYLLS